MIATMQQLAKVRIYHILIEECEIRPLKRGD